MDKMLIPSSKKVHEHPSPDFAATTFSLDDVVVGGFVNKILEMLSNSVYRCNYLEILIRRRYARHYGGVMGWYLFLSSIFREMSG